jgi:hypothetical protein
MPTPDDTDQDINAAYPVFKVNILLHLLRIQENKLMQLQCLHDNQAKVKCMPEMSISVIGFISCKLSVLFGNRSTLSLIILV